MGQIFNGVANFIEKKFGNIELLGYYTKALRNYNNYSRSNRPDFWYFTLVNFLITLAITLITQVIMIPAISLASASDMALLKGFAGIAGVICGAIQTVYSIFILWPSISIAIRRLHDTNRSGWWYLSSFCCFIIPIVFFCLPSVNPNKYDSNSYNNTNINNPKSTSDAIYEAHNQDDSFNM